jgi:O-antigen ligase/tetratricopeptide (TPR) repeat protein
MSGKRRAASSEKEGPSSFTTRCSPLVAFIVAAMEVVLLLLVCLSPWAYGAVHPGFEFLLDVGIAVLLALWAARMLVERQITWKKSGAALCLAGLFLLGVWQRTPLPRSLLAWLSPGTVQCYDQLLPKQPEILPDDVVQPSVGPPPGSTLSLYPGATRGEAVNAITAPSVNSLRLLAVFLVFAVVYNNLTSKEALIRLSIVVLINGVLLSLFALAQFFSAPAKTVYWIYPALGSVFGPFINRNHFPDYVNICIGLGIGLLLSQERRGRSFVSSSEESNSLLQTLHNPLALWICAGLGLMVSAVAFSRSRGGLLALVGASVISGLLGQLRLGRSFRLGSLLLIAGIVAALSAWFGIGLLKDRLATLGESEALEDRVPIWRRSLSIVADFPIWGTGFGTYGYIEPMYRKDAPSQDARLLFDHAHNDYLEILVEGGVVGFCLVLAVLAIVFHQGYRALALNRGSRRAGLALGALFGFTALALHSIGEFGTHIPAITLLATVVCAHLCALGRSKPHQPATPPNDLFVTDSNEYRFRFGGIAPVLGAIAALGFGLVLYASGWKAHRIDRLKNAAFRAGNADVNQLHTRIAYLSAAVPLAPGDAQLHEELGFAHTRLIELLVAGRFPDAGAILEHSKRALQEFLRARDACPLLSGSQLGIAAYASQLKHGDTAEDYVRRAKLLTPGQAEMWFRCGLQEFTLNHFDQAWATWRHCLELSDENLPSILIRARRLPVDQLVKKVLPDNPDLLLVAAQLLYPDSGALAQRRPFLERANQLLESEPWKTRPRELNVGERTQKARLEFARYLYDQGKLEEARRELRLVLADSPKNKAAQELLGMVVRKQRERR